MAGAAWRSPQMQSRAELRRPRAYNFLTATGRADMLPASASSPRLRAAVEVAAAEDAAPATTPLATGGRAAAVRPSTTSHQRRRFSSARSRPSAAERAAAGHRSGGGAASSATGRRCASRRTTCRQSLLANSAQNYGIAPPTRCAPSCGCRACWRRRSRWPTWSAWEVEDFEDVRADARGTATTQPTADRREKTDGCALFWRHEALSSSTSRRSRCDRRRRRHAGRRGAAPPQGQRRAAGRLPRAAQRAPRRRRLPTSCEPIARPRSSSRSEACRAARRARGGHRRGRRSPR